MLSFLQTMRWIIYIEVQDHRPLGSEDFFRLLPYTGVAAILVIGSGVHEQISFTHPTGQAVSEKKITENGGRRMAEQWEMAYLKARMRAPGSFELKQSI